MKISHLRERHDFSPPVSGRAEFYVPDAPARRGLAGTGPVPGVVVPVTIRGAGAVGGEDAERLRGADVPDDDDASVIGFRASRRSLPREFVVLDDDELAMARARSSG